MLLPMPSLRFDFEDVHQRPASRTYEDPEAVWQADSPAEVRSVLQACDAALASGLHVAGFVAYEAAAAFDDALQTRPRDPAVPLAWFGGFRNHTRSAPLSCGKSAGLELTGAAGSAGAYADSVERIRAHIAAGDAYQVNHTTRLRARVRGDTRALYAMLHARQPAQYAAHLQLDGLELLSFSPELFVRRHGDTLSTRPMKGTAARGTDAASDAVSRAALQESPKERAENVMITDLLRNDLGRIALTGTVRVPRLLQVETHPTFHALTSTVTGRVRAGTGLLDTFSALFPCGSVTGAPKASAMGIIARLENAPRGVYCGSIGFATPDDGWAFNVAIRTLQVNTDAGEATYGTGGGVTWDSLPGAEFEEAMLKARFLMEAGQ